MSKGFVAGALSPEALRTVIEHGNKQMDSPPLAARFDKLRSQFQDWLFYLCEGFGVLLHGFGSKRRLLQRFCDDSLTANDVPHFIIRGYLSNVSLKAALLALAKELGLDEAVPKSSSSDVCDLAEAIVSAATDRGDSVPHCVIVVHSMDGPCLRDPKCQTALATLAASSFIRIIASIDHVNASLLWDQSMLSRFRWLWIDATTYDSYEAELLSSDSRLLSLHATKGQAYTHSIASLESLWASLTENARRLLALIARLCIKPSGASGDVPFWQLFREARDDLIVSSELAMRQQMVEFHDHHLVAAGAAGDAADAVRLTVDGRLLAGFLATQGFDECGRLVEEEEKGSEEETVETNGRKDDD